MKELEGKHIVLGLSGGIAAYKSVTLLRLLVKAGAEVQVVMTPSAKEFITPVTLSSLSGKPVVSEFFTANTGEWHSHVDLGLWADLMVIAPATANTIAKMAHGVADNMLVTTYLSAKEPVIVAPAMDLDMFNHPTTKRNLEILASDGVKVLESGEGELASGLSGKGRMMEPEQIFEEIVNFFNEDVKDSLLAGKKVLITAGPTYESIDPVRFIGNHSSGKMGFCLAEEFRKRGAQVTVVAGPVSDSLKLHPAVERIDVKSALEMLEAVEKFYPKCNISVFSAAVADYRPESQAENKIKREKLDRLEINLVKNPDIARTMGERKAKGQLNVGFALETENGMKNAVEKLKNKNFDLVVLNLANREGEGFNADTNRITLIDKGGHVSEFPSKTKKACAADIADKISAMIRL